MSTYGRSHSRTGFWALALAMVAAAAVLATSCGTSTDPAPGGNAGGPPGTNANGGAAAGPQVTLPNTGTPKVGGKLVYGLEAESDGMDPTKGRWAISGLMVAFSVYDPLFAYDANGEAKPYAAESATPAADFKTWTIKLRPGMMFHNNTPVNAAALKRQTEEFKSSTLTGPALRLLSTVDIVDDLTVKMTFSAPWAQFPNILTAQGGALVAPAVFDDKANGNRNPVGSGPFKFKEWKTDDHLSVVRNESYWMKGPNGEQLPYLSEVTFKPIVDAQARENAFEAHDINMTHDNHPLEIAQLKDLAAAGRAQIYADPGEKEETFVMLNTQQAPLDDPLLRQALAYATDVDEYIDVTQSEKTQKADGPFEKGTKWYTDTKFPTNDLAKAQDLMKQYKAKHGEGPVTIKIATTTTTENQRIVQLFQSQWQRIGVTVNAEAVEQIQLITQAITGKYETLLWRQFGAPDPDADWHFWTPKNSQPPGEFALNFSRFKDDATDKALDAGRGTTDFATRKQAYDTVQQRFADQVPYIWLDHVVWYIAADNSVRGIGSNPWPGVPNPQPFYSGAHRLTATWLDPSSK